MFISWTVWLSPWAWTGDDWIGLTFFVLLAAALFARRQVKEAQQLRIEQARPFVIIDFHPWSTIIELKIKNVGRILARDVTFRFDPPLQTTHDETPGRGNLMELNLFKNGIPSLVPGKEIKLFFDQFPARIEAGLPLTYNVQVSYRDHKDRKYSEPTVLDLAMYVGTGGIHRDDIHDIHKRLKELVDVVKKWSAWPGGIKTMSPRDIKEYHEELEVLYAEREAMAAAADAENSNGNETASPA